MKKKLFAIFGPILVAIGLLFLVSNPFPISSHRAEEAATSINAKMLKGSTLQNEVLKNDQYVPFFGSSEYSRFDAFHPSVLAKKYHRDYTPYLLGTRGTTPLVEYTFATSLGDTMKKRKAVFIISPQWFSKSGVSSTYAKYWLSPVQIDQWLLQTPQKIDQSTQYYAERLVALQALPKNKMISRMIIKVKNGKPLTSLERFYVRMNASLYEREERLFGYRHLGKNLKQVDHYEKQLPERYNYRQLDALAERIGQEETDSNHLKIKNSYYRNLESKMPKFKNSQRKTSYIQSPDYSDMQLILNQFAKQKTEVLFFITPVNGQWMKYTGLSEPMMKKMAAKMEYQLKSQGFNHVVNMVDKQNVPYFTTDPIHLGWRGWLYMDRSIKPFLESPYKEPIYKMNDVFYTKEWQKQLTASNPNE